MDKTTTAAATATATVVSFPEDVVREILVRVEDTADLFRCAVTCRRCRRLVAKPSFLRRRWPNPHASSFLSGFFTPKRLALTDPAAATSLIPTPGSVFGPDRRFLGSFFPDAAENGLLDNAVPLTARHGFVLVRLTPETLGWEYLPMAVFNLLAGTCDVLPPLKWTRTSGAIGCAIFTSADCSSNSKQPPSSSSSGYSAFFKLVIIQTDDAFDRPRELHTFTFGEARWRTPCKFSFDDEEIGPLKHPNAAVCRGTAHWLVWHAGCLHTLDMDVETCQVSRTKIAIPIKNSILSQTTHDVPQLSIDAGGTLCLLHLQRQGLLLDIWTRQDDKESGDGGDARWLCTFLELQLPKHIHSEAEAMYLSFLGEKGGMLLLKDNQRHFYSADLKTGVMQELMDCGRISRMKVVPFEMDWPTFFASRLGSSSR